MKEIVEISYVKSIKSQGRLRIVKCSKTGKQIGRAKVMFPKDLREEGVIYRVKNMGVCKINGKKVWVATGRDIKALRG